MLMLTLLNRSLYLIALKLLASGLGFIFFYLLAKELSATEFGLFSLAMTCLVFSTAFAKQGLEQAIVRYSSLYCVNQTTRFYVFVIIYSGLSSVAISLLLYFFLAILR